jgi:hypothetical protein
MKVFKLLKKIATKILPHPARLFLRKLRGLFNTIFVLEGFKLIKRDPVGLNDHRAGWPMVVKALKEHANGGILLDDFVENSFAYDDSPKKPHSEPWIGIVHHPPETPYWLPKFSLKFLLESSAWQRSLSQLRAVVCLSEYLANDLRTIYPNLPITAIRHPTELDVKQWQGGNTLLQAGACGRNVRLIYQFPACIGWKKICLLDNTEWMIQQEELSIKHAIRPDLDSAVERVLRLSNEEYDEILSQAVVVCEILAASANNVILECIARATPIIVNRHPAIVEYLGLNYPLFYDDPNEIPKLLDDKKIQQAHLYLKDLQTEPWLKTENFVQDLISFIKQVKKTKSIPSITNKASPKIPKVNLSGSRITIPNTPSKASSAPLHVITCRFNPVTYEVPIKNYLRFRELLGDIALTTVELSFNNEFKIPDAIHIKGKERHLMWQKENLLNIALKSLPDEVKAVAWIDSDIIFEDSDWHSKAWQALQDYDLIQLFSESHDMNKTEDTSLLHGYAYFSEPQSPHSARLKPGYALAAKREALAQGFFTEAILGAGDICMMDAWAGIEHTSTTKRWSQDRINSYQEWAQKTGTKKLGNIDGVIYHLWHGSPTAKQYTSRQKILSEFDFNPKTDIYLDDNGLMAWTGNKPDLQKAVREYFQNRREDT